MAHKWRRGAKVKFKRQKFFNHVTTFFNHDFLTAKLILRIKPTNILENIFVSACF